jgi:serine/threonine-protein kinase
VGRTVGERVVGRYELVREIGRGGMGEVWEAVDTTSRRCLAIKWLLDQGHASPEMVTRFQREIRVTANVSSRHVVGLHDAGRDDDGHLFMVMDLLDGEDLAGVIDRLGVVPLQLAARVAAQTCDGLALAHAAGIVHRDIKPSNLFLARNVDATTRVVKLLDFGIAHIVADDDATRVTRSGVIVGSPAYMAPEQLRSRRDLDARVDVWALGVVLYQMLAGTLPHVHVQGRLPELMFAICSRPAPLLHERAPWVPRALGELVARALAIRVGDRLASVRELADGLAPWLGGETAIAESMFAPAELSSEHLAVLEQSRAMTHVPMGSTPDAGAPRAGAAPSEAIVVDPELAKPAAKPAITTTAVGPRPVRAARWPFFAALAAILGGALVVRHEVATHSAYPGDVAQAALRHHRRATEPAPPGPRPDPSPSPSPKPPGPQPPKPPPQPHHELAVTVYGPLGDSPGAGWFAVALPHCTTSADALAYVAATPPPNTQLDGTAFLAACYARAGMWPHVKDTIDTLLPADRPTGVGPMVDLAFAMAHDNLRSVRALFIARAVFNNDRRSALAHYLAGVLEYTRSDARAEADLRAFEVDPKDARARAYQPTADALLAELTSPTPSCSAPIVTDPDGIALYAKSCQTDPAK